MVLEQCRVVLVYAGECADTTPVAQAGLREIKAGRIGVSEPTGEEE